MEFDDGEVLRAVGDDANQIYDHIQSGEVMNYIHGIQYQGPTMKTVKEKTT